VFKRILQFLFILLILFVGLLYWSVSSTNQTYSKSEVLNPILSDTINLRKYDSVLVRASTIYESNLVKTLMQGEQYRKAWATPVSARILFLDTLFGGVEILKEGGGKQTHSLKLIDSTGIEYTLRSVNKDPEPLIPKILKSLGLENIVVDGISAQHPYGSILAAELAERAGVIHTSPRLVFLPNQKKLENFNEVFGNSLFLLEYETKSETNWTDFENIVEIIDTDNLQELKLERGDKLRIDKSALIRARLFDMLIGDWDRHTKQFGWAIQKSQDSLVALPISGDRDNAFFKSGGLIPRVLSNKNVLPRMRPYDKKISFMEGLVYPFDRYFLLNTDLRLFIREAENLQRMLNDNVLNSSLKVWPDQISQLDGQYIIEQMKSRRADIVEYAKQFKTEIDKQGELTKSLRGSEGEEFPLGLMRCFECVDSEELINRK